jgi:hypothetical protein
MKKSKWLIIGVVGVLAYLWYKKKSKPTSSLGTKLKDVEQNVEVAVEEVVEEVNNDLLS